MICKICKEDKEKEPVFRSNVTRFVNQSGQLWNGKVCPDCYRTYNRERMRKKRQEKKSNDPLDI